MTVRRRGKVVVLPKFADYLKNARKAAKRGGQKAIANRAKNDGLTLITLNRLKQAEAGIVFDVDPAFLQQLAVIYKTPYQDMVSTLVAEKYGTIAAGIDLIRHDRQIQGTSQPQGGPDVSASARIQKLESQLADRDATLRDIEDVTRRLFALVTGEEGRAAADATPKGSRVTGKARG